MEKSYTNNFKNLLFMYILQCHEMFFFSPCNPMWDLFSLLYSGAPGDEPVYCIPRGFGHYIQYYTIDLDMHLMWAHGLVRLDLNYVLFLTR